jgi:hypothetical protein
MTLSAGPRTDTTEKPVAVLVEGEQIRHAVSLARHDHYAARHYPHVSDQRVAYHDGGGGLGNRGDARPVESHNDRTAGAAGGWRLINCICVGSGRAVAIMMITAAIRAMWVRINTTSNANETRAQAKGKQVN